MLAVLFIMTKYTGLIQCKWTMSACKLHYMDAAPTPSLPAAPTFIPWRQHLWTAGVIWWEQAVH